MIVVWHISPRWPVLRRTRTTGRVMRLLCAIVVPPSFALPPSAPRARR